MSLIGNADGISEGIQTIRAQAAGLRSEASNLDRIADSLAAETNGEIDLTVGQTSGREPAKIAANDDFVLAESARIIFQFRQMREHYFPAKLFSEPAWNMLLDLFVNHIDGSVVGVTSLGIASGSTPTTALRYIDVLIGLGLVQREPSSDDSRVTHVRLTTLGADQMRGFLKLPEFKLLRVEQPQRMTTSIPTFSA